MDEPTIYNCVYDGKTPSHECTGCGACFCETCVLRAGPDLVCPECGGKVEQIDLNKPRNLSKQNFWYYMATALTYPLASQNRRNVLKNVAFVFAFLFLAHVLRWHKGLWLFFLLFAICYVIFLFLTVTQQTAMARNEAPNMPDWGVTDVPFVEILKLFVVLAAWVGPAVGVYFLEGRQTTLLFWGVASVGALCMPMSLLATAAFESFRGVNPLGFLGAIFRVPIQYVACCAFVYVFGLLGYMLLGPGALTGHWLLDVVLRSIGLIYMAFVIGRVLGGLHASNSARFGWVPPLVPGARRITR